MPLRLIEIVLPQEYSSEARDIIDSEPVEHSWTIANSDGQSVTKILLPAEKTEGLMDKLEKKFSLVDGFCLVLLPVEAAIPHLQTTETVEADKPPAGEDEGKTALRISRQELYAEISDGSKLTHVYMAMVVLSSIVAAIGLLRDNVAVVIAAMVIAPLLGPNVALAFATTLGDFELGKEALKTSTVGVLIAFGVSFILGFLLPINGLAGEIVSRTSVSLFDLALALVSGSAGVLAFTSGASATLVGVMVAVALMPPLVTFGLLMGAGQTAPAWGALLLLITNIICVNLAGVSTFLIQGIRPLRWWEANKARKAWRTAIALWALLFILLAGLIVLSDQNLFSFK